MYSKSTVKYIQSLQHKKFRDEYAVFVAEGPKVVTELMQSGVFDLEAAYATVEWISSLDEKTRTLAGSCLFEVKPFELEKLASYSTANSVVAVFKKKEAANKISAKGKLIFLLDDIRDPGNLGTIIRTADWFGIDQIICSEQTVDMYNSKVVQSTMASLGRVNLLYCDLALWLDEEKPKAIYATVLNGEPVQVLRNCKEAVVLIGNESNGISRDLIKRSTNQITIPRYGNAESLNAAVATGIIMATLKLPIL